MTEGRAGQPGLKHGAMMEQPNYSVSDEWIQRFKDDPSQLLIAQGDWHHMAVETFYEIVDNIQPEYPRGLWGLTQLLVLWCDLNASGIDANPLIEFEQAIQYRLIGYPQQARRARFSDREPPGPPDSTEAIEAALNQSIRVSNRIENIARVLMERQKGRKIEEPSGLTENQKDIWNVVMKAGHRMSTKEIGFALEELGCPQGESSLKSNLPLFTQRLAVWTNRDENGIARGYGMPNWPDRPNLEPG